MDNAIEFIGLTKKFPGITANDNINLVVKKGEIHALIGENGAGKSTLMSILFGIYQPTFGSIKIHNNLVHIKNPEHATEIGIGMVHQHFKLIHNYTNLENIILGNEFSKYGFLNYKKAQTKIKLLQKKFGLFFDLNQKTRDADVVVQQKIEIMKMLYKDADILIFDEPTAVLPPKEIDKLLETMLNLKKAGKTILFISHKLHEIKKIVDRATVIRHGKLIKTYESLEGINLSDLTNAMVGQNIVSVKNNQLEQDFGENILEFQNVFAKKIKNLSFKIRRGEIFAITGVEGNGQSEIEFLCSGLLKPKKGNIIFKNENINKLSINKIINKGFSYIPGDRHKYAVALDMDVNENSILHDLNNKTYSKSLFIKNRNIKEFSNMVINKYDVRGASKGNSIFRQLSGGNQQKAVVGREIEKEHDLIVIIQPTRGLDVGAINNIHKYILEEKKNNKAILLISYELDEIISLADTIAVINKGHIMDIQPAKEISREKIGLLMVENTIELEIKNEL